MLGFKRFKTVAITLAGIELLLRIHKGEFDLGRLCLRYRRAPAVRIQCWRLRKADSIASLHP